MRMIAIHAQTERKRLDRSVRCAEKRRPWARKQRLRGLIRPDPAVCATAGAACGRKSLSSARIQAIFTSNDTPLGECRMNEDWAVISGGAAALVVTCRIAGGRGQWLGPILVFGHRYSFLNRFRPERRQTDLQNEVYRVAARARSCSCCQGADLAAETAGTPRICRNPDPAQDRHLGSRRRDAARTGSPYSGRQ